MLGVGFKKGEADVLVRAIQTSSALSMLLERWSSSSGEGGWPPSLRFSMADRPLMGDYRGKAPEESVIGDLTRRLVERVSDGRRRRTGVMRRTLRKDATAGTRAKRRSISRYPGTAMARSTRWWWRKARGCCLASTLRREGHRPYVRGMTTQGIQSHLKEL